MPSVLAHLPRLELGLPARWTDQDGPVLQRWLDNDRRLIATGGRVWDEWWVHWHGLATFWFGEAGVVRANPIGPGLEHDVCDVFTRAIVPMVLLARGFEALHASAVMDASGVIGLCGLSGTGKSTLAMALANCGSVHFADDTVVYRVIGGEPVAVGLPFTVRVDASAHAAAGRSPERSRNSNAASLSVPLKRIYQLARDASLDPVTPVILPVPPEKRFAALLAHAHPFEMGTTGRRRAFLENLMALARTVDVWECRFAPDLEALPSLTAVIRNHLSEA